MSLNRPRKGYGQVAGDSVSISLQTSGGQGTGERLAYVLDDEEGIRAFVCHVLAANGFTAHPFSSNIPLLARLAVHRPELLVLDLALGPSDAVEVIRHLEVLRYKGKVLLISGRDETTLAEIKQIGTSRGLAMLPPLRKPFRANDFIDRLSAEADIKEPPLESHQVGANCDLEEALRNDWLELWYQPKVDLKSLLVCGAEALLRARHPQHGIIAPAGLLPPTGDPLHQPLARFVMQQAMADWGVFENAGMPLKLAVNMPVSVIHAADFVSLVRTFLPQHSKFPGLIVEVTEDEVIRDPELIREVAAQLKLYNVGISIDDFGSAYSSLSRLLDLTSVELKLDRQFVSDCSSDQLKRALCQTIVELAHRFGALVCAEGVESPQDVRALIDMGCDMAQGFFFAKPMEPKMLIRKLLERAKTRVEMPDDPLGHGEPVGRIA